LTSSIEAKITWLVALKEQKSFIQRWKKTKRRKPPTWQTSLKIQRFGNSKIFFLFLSFFLSFFYPQRHLPPYPAFLNNACFTSSELSSILCSISYCHDKKGKQEDITSLAFKKIKKKKNQPKNCQMVYIN